MPAISCNHVPLHITQGLLFLTSIFSHFHSYCSYKPERYYWEAVITARKVSVVALTVFGKEIGVQRQSQIALLILLACIVFEILGHPFARLQKRMPF